METQARRVRLAMQAQSALRAILGSPVQLVMAPPVRQALPESQAQETLVVQVLPAPPVLRVPLAAQSGIRVTPAPQAPQEPPPVKLALPEPQAR